jgi:hypothetical protein
MYSVSHTSDVKTIIQLIYNLQWVPSDGSYAPFLLQFLIPCVNGYPIGWFHVKLWANAGLAAVTVLSSLTAEHTNHYVVGSHYQLMASSRQQQSPGSYETKVFLSTGMGAKFKVCCICFLYHYKSAKFFVLIL